MRERSIARRLILSVLLIQAVTAIGFIGATLFHERKSRLQAFDVMLRGRADSVLAAVQDADDEADDIVLDRKNLQVPPGDVFEVEDAAGRLLGRSSNWSGAQPKTSEVQGAQIFQTGVAGLQYRLIRLNGVRVVDPGKANGGTSHTVQIVYGSQTRKVWEEIRETVLFSAGASCLLLMVTGTLVAWLLHRGLSPLRELAAEAEGVSAERWSFRSPESARGTSELATLALALESAVGRLERSFDQQRRFVSDSAHELKTAVAVIKSSLQLLTMRRRSAEDYETGVHRSLSDCERMEEIVAEMLTLARIEGRPARERRNTSTDFARSAAIAAEHLQPLADLRGVQVKLDFAGCLHVGLSEEECTLLCRNLLMNAIVHGAGSNQVQVTAASSEQGWTEFRFEDFGEGIDEAVLPHVFERFYRGDASRARVTGGSGLGLAICRAIVESAGGSIRLDSQRGVGTTATVRLRAAVESHGVPTDMVEVSSGSVNHSVED